MARPRKEPIYTLPHGIEVLGEYAPRGQNRYWRARIRPHHFFDVEVIHGSQSIRRSRVVMASKLGRKLLESEHVHHINEDVNDDSPENLELTDSFHHNRHHKTGAKHREETKSRIGKSLSAAYRSGKKKKPEISGESNPSSKLTETQVKEIKLSDRPSRELGKIYGVSKTTILHIKSGKIWSHIKC